MALHHSMLAIVARAIQHQHLRVISLARLKSKSNTTVIFDGECRFCKASIDWLALKLDFTAHPFQSADLAPFNLSREECAKEVIAIQAGKTFRGSESITLLLRARGNRFLAALITASGFIGRCGYRWIASHRGSFLVKLLTKILERKLVN
jgi:predicted DCC family thiol-disulfide oxidoreductase YuxK